MTTKLTTRHVDRFIRSGALVEFRTVYGETFTAQVMRRDRWCFETAAGGRFDRTDITDWQEVA